MTDHLESAARSLVRHMNEVEMDAETASQKVKRMINEIEVEGLDPEEISRSAIKGQTNENQAVTILSGTHGSTKVEKVHSTYGDDPFRIVDIEVVLPDQVKFVQVKTNDFSPDDASKIESALWHVELPGCVELEVWVRVDYDGWELYQYRPGSGFHRFAELPVNKDDAIEAYRELNGYYD